MPGTVAVLMAVPVTMLMTVPMAVLMTVLAATLAPVVVPVVVMPAHHSIITLSRGGLNAGPQRWFSTLDRTQLRPPPVSRVEASTGGSSEPGTHLPEAAFFSLEPAVSLTE